MPATDNAGSSYPDFTTRNIALQPGETRVFYAIADQRFDDPSLMTPSAMDMVSGTTPDARWGDYLNSWGELPIGFDPSQSMNPVRDLDQDGFPDGVNDGRGWTGPAEEWLNHQLRVQGSTGDDPVMMMSFDPTDGSLLDKTTGGFERLDQVTATPVLSDASRADLTEVRLWKKVVTRGEETTDPNIPGRTARNVVENDMLVDRMTVPVFTPTVNASGPVDIEDTWSYPEDFPAPDSEYEMLGARNDNTGITISDWFTVRRADSPTQEAPSIGQITPWILRARNNPSLTQTQLQGYIDGTLDPDEVFDGDVSDPDTDPTVRGDYEVTGTLREFWDYSRNTGANAIVQTLALAPHGKSNVVQPFIGPNAADDDNANNSLAKFPPFLPPWSGANLDSTGGMTVPEIFVGGIYDSQRARLADLLLAWGIGSTYAPDPSRVATTGVGFYGPDEWMTTAEAMAVALGIDTPVPTGPDFPEPDQVWLEAWGATPEEHLLEDGHLALDRFVPFLNQTIESPIEFTVGDDILRGSGVPMALGVIDRARAIKPLERVTDPINPSGQAMTELELTRPTFGTININTAPVEVLRLLPGLTPSRAQYVKDAVGGLIEPEWWGANLSYPNLELPDLSTTGSGTDVLVENPDVAAAIVAYRDRTFGYPNTAAHPNAATAGSENYFDQANETALFFSVNNNALNLGSVAENYLSEDPVNNLPASVVNSMDRRTFTGIDGLRLTPGFGSLGELLAVQLDPEFETSDMTRWQRLRHLSIQQLGYDGRAQGIDTGPDGEITILPQVFGNNQVGSTVDDYAEKLAMANSVVNMLSVRSDYYAVWFVLQGYKESDVANLRPEDPMIPSLHKRYLMVVDRSNVVEPGDKPKIVLLKEIPL